MTGEIHAPMTSSPRGATNQLLPIVRAYLRQASALDLQSLTENQDGPWTNVAFGAAGIAYALWRAAGPGRRERLEQAERLLGEAALAAPKDRWPAAASIPSSDLGSGLYYGSAGIGCVRILVARARGDLPTYERELSAFIATCRAAEGGQDELLVGIAGLLNGARLLHKYTNDERIGVIADTLSESLNQRANGDGGGWAMWAATSGQGFAHGAPGILHAILAWSHQAQRDPPAETIRALTGFVERTNEDPFEVARQGALPPVMERSFCNGSAGHALLWTKAYECTGQRAYLQMARASARSTLAGLRGASADLCCGFGGRAFALLAMERVEPGRGWYDRAIEMAFRAMRAAQAGIGAWPNGLLKGYPGLVCLVGDLDAPPQKRKGFPLVEG
jgi:hypothetical protein